MYLYLVPPILSHEDLLEALFLGGYDDGVYVGHVKRSVSTGFRINLYNVRKEGLKLVEILSTLVGIPGEGQDLNPKLNFFARTLSSLSWRSSITIKAANSPSWIIRSRRTSTFSRLLFLA